MTNGTSHRKADAAAKRGILLVSLLRDLGVLRVFKFETAFATVACALTMQQYVVCCMFTLVA